MTILRTKTFRIEYLGVGKVLGVVLDRPDWYKNGSTCRYLHFRFRNNVVDCANSMIQRKWRIFSQSFWKISLNLVICEYVFYQGCHLSVILLTVLLLLSAKAVLVATIVTVAKMCGNHVRFWGKFKRILRKCVKYLLKIYNLPGKFWYFWENYD